MKTFLIVVAVGQGAFLVVTFMFLTVRRWRTSVRIVRREREQSRLSLAVHKALNDQLTGEELVREIDHCGFDNVTAVLQQHASQNHADRWESVAEHIRRSHWYVTVTTRYVRSRLWWHRLMSARALAILGAEADLEAARLLIGDRHAAVKLAAISIASQLHDPDILEALLGEAVNARRVVRQYMFDKLVEVGPPLVPVLKTRLSAPRSVFELCDLVRLAGALTAPDLKDRVLALADHEDKGVRGAVARALAQYGGNRASAALETMLADTKWEVRTRAASALGIIGHERSAEMLRGVLRDANWWVRLRAAIALRQIGPRGTTELKAVASGDDRYASEMANYALRLTEAAVKDYAA